MIRCPNEACPWANCPQNLTRAHKMFYVTNVGLYCWYIKDIRKNKSDSEKIGPSIFQYQGLKLLLKFVLYCDSCKWCRWNKFKEKIIIMIASKCHDFFSLLVNISGMNDCTIDINLLHVDKLNCKKLDLLWKMQNYQLLHGQCMRRNRGCQPSCGYSHSAWHVSDITHPITNKTQCTAQFCSCT